MDLATRTLHAAGGDVVLTEIEAKLLGHLAARAGEVVSKDALLREVWGYSARVVSRTVDTAVYRLRTKIEADPAAPVQLLTVPNAGYRLVLDAAPAAAPEGLVGRADVLAAIEDALGRSPLVTLTGPGGAGKTTLARAVAARHGVPLVPLAGLSTTAELVRAVAGALGAAAVDDLAGLAALLARRSGLLVLDDLDHAVVAAGELLARVPVRALVTSREVLARPGEAVVRVAGLPAPDALALFARRRVGHDAAWSDPGRVGPILEAVDRLPLAIELAAGWTDVLGPDELAARLDRQLDVLRAATPTPGDRHADLRTIVTASWDLLAPADRAGLCALAVFEGPFRLAEAEEVLPDAALAVRTLVRRSLLQPEEGGFRMFAAVRRFARERGVPAEVRARHRAWLAGLARGLLPALDSARRPEALATGARLRGDLEAALRGALPAGDPGAACAIARLLADLPGRIPDRLALLGPVLPAADPPLLAAFALLAKNGGRIPEARAAAERALAGARAAGDVLAEVDALDALGVVARDHGDPAEAEARLDAALSLARASGSAIRRGRVAIDRGWLLATRGRTAEAEAAYREAIAVLPADAPARAASAYANLGNLLRETGRDPTGALAEALARHRAAGNRVGEGIVAGGLASYHAERGALAEAGRWFEVCLDALREVGQRHAEHAFLANRAYWHRVCGRPAEARADLAAARAVMSELGDRRMLAMIDGNEGELLLAEGRAAEAAVALRQAAARAAESGATRLEGVFRGGLGLALARSGGDGDAELDRAEALLSAAGFAEEALRIRLRRGLARVAGGDLAAARAIRAGCGVPEGAPRWLVEDRDALDAALA